MSWFALGAAALQLGGTLLSSAKQAAARKSALDHIDAEYYKNPLDTVGGRALLKKRAQDREDAIAAQNNRAVAGGATFENQLAMRKALNRADSDFESNLLISQEARRQALGDQRSQIIQGGLIQDAQNWQAWGNAASSALMTLGSTSLLDRNAQDSGKALTFGEVGRTKAIKSDNSLGTVTGGNTSGLAGYDAWKKSRGM